MDPTLPSCHWRSPPRRIVVPNSNVDLWKIDLAPKIFDEERLMRALSGDERARARRCRDVIARRFIVGRYALRILLGRYTGRRPDAVRLAYGPQGKPYLAAIVHGPWFNLCHSGDIALLAVSGAGAIGIDIERIRRIAHPEQVAERFFTDDTTTEISDAFRDLTPVHRFFLRWTAFEATRKAQGIGVFSPAHSASDHVTVAPDAIRHFIPAANHIAAAAMPTGLPPVQRWSCYECTQTFLSSAEDG